MLPRVLNDLFASFLLSACSCMVGSQGGEDSLPVMREEKGGIREIGLHHVYWKEIAANAAICDASQQKGTSCRPGLFRDIKEILCDFFIFILEQIIVLNTYCTYNKPMPKLSHVDTLHNSCKMNTKINCWIQQFIFKRRLWSN